MNIKILKERLIYIRKLSGLSRCKIEREYGISISSIRNYESSESAPSVTSLIEYLEVFKKVGINICLDRLFDTSKNIIEFTRHSANHIKDGDIFVQSVLGRELFVRKPDLMFYANQQAEILFMNKVFSKLIDKNPPYCTNYTSVTSCASNMEDYSKQKLMIQDSSYYTNIDALYIYDIIPDLKNNSETVNKILEGQDIEMTLNLDYIDDTLHLQLKPNFCMNNSVIGIAAIIC